MPGGQSAEDPRTIGSIIKIFLGKIDDSIVWCLPMDTTIGIVKGLLSPFEAVLNPKNYYIKLKSILDKYGIYARATIFFGSWIGVSIFTFLIVLIVEAIRSLMSLNISGFIFSPFRALIYALLFPFVPAFIDSLLIAAVISPFPRKRALYDVFVIRASTLFPYTLRVVLL
jgi:hypothetical protein